MELKAFVARSLLEIVEGVVEASERISELGGAVSPAYSASGASEHIGTTSAEGKPVHAVHFDVALVVESANRAEGKEELTVVSVGSQVLEGTQSASHELSSRLRFVIPLQLPTDETSEMAAQQAAARKKAAAQRAIDNARARRSGYP